MSLPFLRAFIKYHKIYTPVKVKNIIAAMNGRSTSCKKKNRIGMNRKPEKVNPQFIFLKLELCLLLKTRNSGKTINIITKMPAIINSA